MHQGYGNTSTMEGLRTLELCVDNLQPDFLYDHIQPVRAELFQALWKTLRNPNENIARIAFRVLGKFGGGNRRMLKEPQKNFLLRWQSPQIESKAGPFISPALFEMSLDKVKIFMNNIHPNRRKLIAPRSNPSSLAFRLLILSGDIPLNPGPTYRFKEGNVPFLGKTTVQHCNDVLSKKSLEQALTGALLSASIKELRSDAVPFMCNLIRHLTLIAVVQQTGPCPIKPQNRTQKGMDVHVLCDAIAAVMAMEDKEFCSVGELAVSVMIETATAVTSDSYKSYTSNPDEVKEKKLKNLKKKLRQIEDLQRKIDSGEIVSPEATQLEKLSTSIYIYIVNPQNNNKAVYIYLHLHC
ncbi:predicted protein [Nematostella vectensis]|uniref:Uncharacterized protein n=1 Tax=Nematostella vectensis TaxID=45351 RepID=A7T200_NEMVE|nr:predicted protein [Nematostella vectensis]|eukprot:XP_001622117.1 predicted protein [Nematostella vectensis]